MFPAPAAGVDVPLFRPPPLTVGDVREILSWLDTIEQRPLSLVQRRAIEALRGRLEDTGAPLPDAPGALASWFLALVEGEKDTIVRQGIKALNAVITSGESSRWEVLQAGMEQLATMITTLREKPNAGPEAGADGPLAEKGSADGLDWYEPSSCPLYSLHGEHGARLRALVVSLRNAPRRLERGIDAPTRIRFEGPPGTGKTAGARWIGRELDQPVAVFRLDAIGSSWKNRTPRNLRACMDAVVARKGIALIDEIDGLVSRRDKSDDSADRHVVTALFQLLDALPQEQIVIACTNLPDSIDPALARRLGTRITFPMPDANTRVAIVQHCWAKMALDPTHAPRGHLVRLTDGRSCDTVRRVAHAAAGRAIDAGRDEVLLEDVAAAMLAEPREGKLEPAPASSGLLL